MPTQVNLPDPATVEQAGSYGALDLRRAMHVGRREGVVAFTHLKVTQRAGGAGLGVDVAAGEALIQGDSVANQGLYHAILQTALTGATQLDISAGDATLPRVDTIILEIKDDLYDASGLNRAQIRRVQGTPTAGANRTNRSGAGVTLTPTSAIVLADIEVAATAASISNANIADRRGLVLPTSITDTFANLTNYSAALLPNGTAFTSSDLGGEWLVANGAWVQVTPMVGTLANRPTAATAGNLGRYEATDDWGGTLYESNASTWRRVWSRNEKILTLAAAASGSFTGLDGDTDGAYDLFFDADIAGTGGVSIGLRPNGDATAGNYQQVGQSEVAGAGPSLQDNSSTDRMILYNNTNAPMRVGGHATIFPRTGGRRVAISSFGSTGTGVGGRGHADNTTVWNPTAGNITTLDILSGGAGGTMTGTVTLRRMKAP